MNDKTKYADNRNMKNLLAVFGDRRSNSSLSKKSGILSQPGDFLEARVTETGRNVIKIQKDRGNVKYSATQYPNGTVVETKVTKKK